MNKLDEVMDEILRQIKSRVMYDDTEKMKHLAEAYHFIACTKVLTPWSPTKVETSELNARLA